MLALKPRSLALLAVALLAQACVVNIDDKQGGGSDPCDPNPCEQAGVCTGWTATCTAEDGKAVCSDWKPSTGTGTAPEAYEADETLCDGKDNDCDGLTDEGLSAPADACPSQGVCADTPATASCVGGAWVCNFAVNPAYEVSETRCDGKDNDCDGKTDEDVSPTATACKRAGVCAGLAPPTCESGAWACHYDKAADYEESETACDGKDNDCDGAIDANLAPSALPGGQSCPTAGVCAAGVKIVCQAGQPSCGLDAIVDWEPFETLCDGKDNDCDGKTDNVQGTSAPLLDADVASCATQGVCKGAGPGQITRACQAGVWTCSYAGVPAYQAVESLCDGKDNDCDGDIDEALKPPAISPCGDQGVCNSVVPICAAGIWTCDKKALADAGFEPTEATCDGKDNDCDGSTDETLAPAANGCMTKGACALGVAVKCEAGVASCDYAAVLGYQAATETACDGKDNDCDGQTDETEALDAADSGCGVGVCAGAAKATCGGGKWQCSYDGVADYEQNETLCDGKDNDCDGQTDEGLGAAIAAKCNKAGVCADGVVAACVAGKAICAYQSVDYQGAETLCDGKDNDCDGITDPGLCGSGQPCVDDSSCKAGTCATALGSTSKVCTAKVGQCARAVDGQITLTDAGTTICADTGSTLTCSGGSFGSPVACPKDKPACQDGVCKLCIAGKKRCDPDKPADVLQCAGDGSSESKAQTCSTGKCAGDGICVETGVLTVTSSANDNSSRPSAAAVGDGFVVVWFAGQSFSDTLFGRMHDATGKAVGTPFGLASNAGPSSGAAPRVAPSGDGFVVVWSSGSGQQSPIARRFDKDGKAIGSEITVSADTAEVVAPAVAGNANGFVVAWEANGAAGTKLIRAARFGTDGVMLGSVVEVSTGSGESDPLTGGTHRAPAVALHSGGGFSVAWARSQSGQNDGVWWRAFDASGSAVTAGQRISGAGKTVAELRMAPHGTGAAVSWQETTGGAAGEDIALVTVDGAGKVGYGPAIANATTDGSQAWPALAAGAARLVLIWAAAASDGGDLMGRDLLASGAWSASADGSASAANSGVQDQPAVVTFADGRVLSVWRQRTSASETKAQIQAAFR